MKGSRNNIKELWDFLFKVFPIVDLPFSVLAIYSSDHWLITLIIAILFPIVASTVFYFSNKKGFQPGYLIMSINGLLFIPYMYYSGANSPTWLNVIVITVGSSFMFNNPKVGQYMVAIWSFCIGMFYYSIGASIEYSLLITFVILGFVILFSRAFAYLQKQQAKIEEKNKEIENKSKDITDSINYAKRIQYTLLAHKDFLKQHLPEHFIFFKPKDIVSGDFYWATHHNNKFYLAVCDSTGHGVPGAFMSLLNIGFLTEAINEKGIAKPNEVFDFVRERLINSISKEGQMDGFDGILICFDKTNNTITYASANNAPVLMHNGKFIELSTDKMPVGIGEIKNNFKLHTIESSKGDVLYLYTDGYADQFGGPKGKKFKYKQLNELLLSEYEKPLNVQHENIKKAFETWQGNLEQVDDVCILGIRI